MGERAGRKLTVSSGELHGVGGGPGPQCPGWDPEAETEASSSCEMAVRILGSLGPLEPWAVGAGGASESKQCGRGSVCCPQDLCLSALIPSFLHSLTQQGRVHEVPGEPAPAILSLGTAAWMPSVHSLHSRPVSEQRQGLDQAWWGCRTVPG